jgi:catechol 2,3-dioxygenase-like lactoylglutathione lyase family enzyme
MRSGQPVLVGLRRALAGLFVIAPLIGFSPASAIASPAEAASATRPSSAAIRTPDFDETLQWYQDTLGFRRIASQSFVQGRRAVMERSGFLLEVSEVDRAPQQPGAPDATGAVAVTRSPVISIPVPDVDREIARLKAKGVEVLLPPEDELEGTYRIAQIRDNGRHRIELREPLGDPGGFNPVGR